MWGGKCAFGLLCYPRSLGERNRANGGFVEQLSFQPSESHFATALYQAARHVCRTLQDSGFEAYFVGGVVRDFLLNPDKALKDIDIATSAPPEEVHRIFSGSEFVGKAFGVCLVKVWGAEKKKSPFCFEVATFRREAGYSDRRHPDVVEFGTLAEDSLRRDFTMNALYFDPVKNIILDMHRGVEAIKSRSIRAVGVPRERFYEDALRIVRLFRFAANCELRIDHETLVGAIETSDGLKFLSGERVILECAKVLPGRFRAFAEALFENISPFHFDDKLPTRFLRLGARAFWPEGVHMRHPLVALSVLMAGEGDGAKECFVLCAEALECWPGTRADSRILKNMRDILIFLELEESYSRETRFLSLYRLCERFRGISSVDTLFFMDSVLRMVGASSSLLSEFVRVSASRVDENLDAVDWMRGLVGGRVTSVRRKAVSEYVSAAGGVPQLIGVWSGLIEARFLFGELGMKLPPDWQNEPDYEVAQKVLVELN